MIKTIYLDLDEVITNMLKSVAVIFERNYDELMANWTPGNHKIEEGLGVSKETFYEKLKEAGEDFWANLEMYPWSMELIDYCQKIAPVIFLTKPTLHQSCAAGKIKWFHKHFGYDFQDYIITARKEECSKPGKILIDDWEKNIVKFDSEGGEGILFPTITNKNHMDKDRCFDYVKEKLNQINIDCALAQRILS